MKFSTHFFFQIAQNMWLFENNIIVVYLYSLFQKPNLNRKYLYSNNKNDPNEEDSLKIEDDPKKEIDPKNEDNPKIDGNPNSLDFPKNEYDPNN